MLNNAAVPTLSEVLAEVRKHSEAGEPVRALGVLRRLTAEGGLRGEQFSTVGASLEEIRASLPHETATTKVAVLGGYTTGPIVAAVRCALLADNVVAEVYEAPFGAYVQDILDAESGLYRFGPDVIVLAVSYRDVVSLPTEPVSDEAVAAALDAEVERWQSLWRISADLAGVPVLQHLMEVPAENGGGMAERRMSWSRVRFISELNRRLVDEAPAFVRWIDVDGLASRVGSKNWNDPRLYHYGKIGFNVRFLGEYARALAGAWRSSVGRTKKALVVDLDNTLWGGVVGDDGMDGIQLGSGTPAGEAYSAFCSYLSGLSHLGVVLAACSKGDRATAEEVFSKHPGMPLRLDQFGAFVRNWDDKATNIRSIAKQLNLDPSALAFVDDSAAECELVRRELPEVAVVQLPEDPALFIHVLDDQHLFDSATLSQEDLQRTKSYAALRQATELESQATDLDSFLRELEMVGTLYQATDVDLVRLSQMEPKTNQFNLTTRRYTEPDLRRFIADPQYVALAFQMKDRFADHGLVSSLIAHEHDGMLLIDSWLMSCRIFSRTAEQFILNHITTIARGRGLNRIVGEYLPTSKNEVVRPLYGNLGFKPVQNGEPGRWWSLSVGASRPKALKTFILLEQPADTTRS